MNYLKLFVLAILVKLPFITDFNIWHDEGYSLALTDYSFTDIWYRTSLDVHPPFYYYYLKVFRTILDNPLFLRLSSIILFALTASLIINYASKKFMLSSKMKLILTGLILTNPLLHRYSYELRMYMLMALLAVLIYIFIEKYLEVQNKLNLGLLALALALSYYTHYFSFLIVGTIGVYCLYTKKFKKILSPILLSLVLFLPWLPKFVLQLSAGEGLGWLQKSDLLSVFRPITKSITYVGNTHDIVLIIGIVLATWIIFSYRVIKAKFLLESMFALIPLIAVFLSYYKAVYHPRYIVFSVVFLLLVIVLLLKDKMYLLQYRALLVSLFVFQLIGVYIVHQENLSGVSQAHSYISNNNSEGGNVVANQVYSLLSYEYYSKSNDYVLVNGSIDGRLEYTIIEDESRIITNLNNLDNNSDIWLISRDSEFYNELIPDNFTIILEEQFGYTLVKKLTKLKE